jgi:hypothetical protein
MELRAPTEKDVEGRFTTIRVEAVARMPRHRNVQVQLIEASEGGMAGWMEVRYPDGTRRGLGEILVEGESAPLGEPPAAFHPVRRDFVGVEELLCDGEPVGYLRVVTAEVGDIDAPFDFTIGGMDEVAWMLKNTLTGARVWFAHNGRYWSTED